MWELRLATLTRLELATSAVTGRRANQLRHRAILILCCLKDVIPRLRPHPKWHPHSAPRAAIRCAGGHQSEDCGCPDLAETGF